MARPDSRHGHPPAIRRSERLLATLLLLVGCLAAPSVALGASSGCRTLPPLPGTPADSSKAATSQSYCEIDFGSSNVAVCPKNWSTSAAMLVYDTAGTQWDTRRDAFEREVCPLGKHAREKSRRELAVFKHSMNFPDTSGTYAPAVLLYDHLSRWLGTTVQVPAAAELRFDRQWYSERVAAPGLALAQQHSSRKMLLAAWDHVNQALASDSDRSEFLLEEESVIWGAALLFTGSRYGPEVNGTRASGWGKGQNLDFQKTAPFIALRHPAELQASVTAGIEQARLDPAMSSAVAVDINHTQVAWWMLELLDVVVLDYLLGQQDRIGNIDYQWRWLWRQGDRVMSAADHGQGAPTASAVRLRTTWLNDNDAGVRSGYANYARKTDMLVNIRHFNPSLYKRLKALTRDLDEAGPVYQAIGANYHLSARELAAIRQRGAEIDHIITTDCKAGNYRFDLTPANILSSESTPEEVSCD